MAERNLTPLSPEELFGGITADEGPSRELTPLSPEDLADIGVKPTPKKKRVPFNEAAPSIAKESAVRLSHVPVDIGVGVANIPALVTRGASWLAGKMPGQKAEESASTLRDAADTLTPTWLNENVTSDAALARLQRAGVYEPKETDYPYTQRLLAYGPSYFGGGALFKLPHKLNVMTSVASPLAGELGYNFTGSPWGRVGGEVGAALATPIAYGLGSAAKKQAALWTKKPLQELTPDSPEIRRAMPILQEEMSGLFGQPTREQIISSVANPEMGRRGLQGVVPGLRRWQDRMRENAQTRIGREEGRALSKEVSDIGEARANLSAAEMEWELAKAAAQRRADDLRTLRPSEDIGHALHGEVVGVRDAVKKVTDPAYKADWGKTVIPAKDVEPMVNVLDDLIAKAKLRKDSAAIGDLESMRSKLVGEIPQPTTPATGYGSLTPQAKPAPIIAPLPQRADVLMQIRRDIDSHVRQVGFMEGKPAAKQKAADMAPARSAANVVLDSSTDPLMLNLRAADEVFSSIGAPIGEGLTKQVIKEGELLSPTGGSWKNSPAAAAVGLIKPGEKGVSSVMDLEKLMNAQASIGNPSQVKTIVQDFLNDQVRKNIKDGNVAAAIEKVSTDFAPFIRTWDARFGSQLGKSVSKQLDDQMLLESRAAELGKGVKTTTKETNSAIAEAELKREQAVAKATERSGRIKTAIDEDTITNLVRSPDRADLMAGMLKDPQQGQEVLRLVRKATKQGYGNEMYEGILGTFQQDLRSALSMGKGQMVGSPDDVSAAVDRYVRAARAAGAPEEMLNNMRKAAKDVEMATAVGAVGSGQAAARIAEGQVLRGLMGRPANLISGVERLLNRNDLSTTIYQMALRDPAVARALFAYRGTNPQHFRQYLMKTPALAAILNQPEP
jgi:hypothetical protein